MASGLVMCPDGNAGGVCTASFIVKLKKSLGLLLGSFVRPVTVTVIHSVGQTISALPVMHTTGAPDFLCLRFPVSLMAVRMTVVIVLFLSCVRWCSMWNRLESN